MVSTRTASRHHPGRVPALRRLPARPIPDTVACPECGGTAVVEWRDVVQSTEGPVEHVKIRCSDRHWFLMLAESLGR